MEPSVTGARLVVDPASVTPDPRVPGSGVVQLHVVVPPSERDLRWGVAGIVERSDGGRWIPAGSFALSLEKWGGTGRVAAPGEPLTVRRIGLGADAAGHGPLGRLDLAGLAPGSYRLVQQGRTDTDPPTGSGRQIVGHVEVAASPG